MLTGLVHPSVIQFSPDGRIFVAEKRGTIKVFNSLTDTSPATFADLQSKVDDYWDRGLLGMALPPNFPTNPWVYVLYTYDAAIGATAPRWNDGCPTPPGPTTDGCVVSGRLSRISVSTGAEQVLINDWCQQFPSHSIGTVTFGPDGALYVSGGDGASFNFADYGQAGGSLSGTPTPVNPCNDPASEGGALRSQDIRTMPAGGGGTDYKTTVLSDNAFLPAADGRVERVDWRHRRQPAGTTSGAPTYGAPGAVTGHTAIDFDAETDRFTIADHANLDLGTTFTVEAWIARDDVLPNVYATAVDKGTGSYQIGIDPSDHYFLAKGGIALAGLDGNNRVPADGSWHHVVWTFTPGTQPLSSVRGRR